MRNAPDILKPILRLGQVNSKGYDYPGHLYFGLDQVNVENLPESIR